jgi:hypothetical protein
MPCVAVHLPSARNLPALAAHHAPCLGRIRLAAHEQINTSRTHVAGLLSRFCRRVAFALGPDDRFRSFGGRFALLLRNSSLIHSVRPNRLSRIIIGAITFGVHCSGSFELPARSVACFAARGDLVPAPLPFLAPVEWAAANDAHFNRKVFLLDSTWHRA